MVFQKELADPASPKRVVPTRPLVDVNLVTYNHEKYVARAIESVLEQKTNFDYRLIIGDDCSTDNTQSIIRQYAQQYPERIQVMLASDQKEISTVEDIITGMVPLPCTVMFRNNLLGELPDWFYKVTNADWIMCVLLAEHGHIGYINEVMAAYRMHPEGIWSRLTPQ